MNLHIVIPLILAAIALCAFFWIQIKDVEKIERALAEDAATMRELKYLSGEE